MEALVHVYADGVKEARMRYNQSRYIALHGVLVILYFKIRTDERLTLTEQKCHSSNGHGQGIVHSSVVYEVLGFIFANNLECFNNNILVP